MKIGTKIILGFSAPILMFFAFGIWLQFVMVGVSDQMKHVRDESVAFALTAKDMEMNVAQVQQFLSDISATRAMDGLNTGLKDAEIHYNNFLADLAKFEQMYAAEGDMKGLENCKMIRADFNTFYTNGIKLAHTYIDGGPSMGNKLMPDFDKTSLVLQKSLAPFIKAQLDEMNTAVEKARSETDKSRIVGLIIGLLIIVTTALLSVYVIRDLRNLSGVLDSLTYKVRTSASEIAAAVNEQASITTEQSASLTEITTTMEEFSASSSQIADSANSVAQLSKNMLAETDRSVESLGSLKTKMDEIETDNKNSIHEILELDRKSKEIGKIMGIINNIADQTKMIAFNAAIEASSAGEAGKRFSVVAGEIRRLADNVMESTGEIQGKIDEIQKAANRLVIVSEKGAKTVREGADYATATLDDLVNIVAGTKSSTESAIQISFSTQQQKTASGQILTALKEIDQGLHQSSTAIHQTSSSAIAMGDMANTLQEVLSKFKMENKKALPV